VALPSLSFATWIALLIVLVGVGIAAAALRLLAIRRREAAYGSLRAIDAGRPMVLRSARYRLQGRPDEVRQLRDGRLVPIELKSRKSPASGPTHSHTVQVWAYCLLIEETSGRSPPFGVLRYADAEFRIPWNDAARRELLALRAELSRPYDGRATPSIARCAHCAWVRSCDARILRN
jgi:CRISPR-associated exonuclease Cas4